MADPQPPSFFRKVGLAAWAMFTLILVFCVLLLANELMKSGKNPLDLSKISGKENAATAQGPSSTSQLTNIPIYVISADGAALVHESRNIPFGENTVDNCRAALEELRKPSQNIGCTSVLPQITEYNALFLYNGELVVDFKLTWQNAVPKSATAESLMVYGVVNTLTQAALKGSASDQVKSVRFLFEGQAPSTVQFPQHLDLSQPITPDPQWIRKVETAQ